MQPLGYVGQTAVVRVTFPGGESAEVEFPIKASFQSIFHRVDVKLKLKYPEMTGTWSDLGREEEVVIIPDERESK